jgi:YHS domain-containing protein
MRALVELLLVIAAAFVARAVLTSLVRGFFQASARGYQNAAEQNRTKPRQSEASPTGELHKDPVCGTYVAETTGLNRQVGGKTFYYCSHECREKHALVAH